MSNFFNGDKDYADATREVDSMLKQFEKDRNVVTSLLTRDPKLLLLSLWKANSPISKDDGCLFQMGKNMSMSIDDILSCQATICDTMANFYVCPQCKNMRRLIDFAGNKKTNQFEQGFGNSALSPAKIPGKEPNSQIYTSEPFLLECGEKVGNSLYYEEKKISALHLVLESPPFSVKRAYTNPYIAELAQCTSATCAIPSKEAGSNLLMKYMETDYLGTDLFTNNMLINFYLGEELMKKKMPHILSTHISFVCNDKGYNINEYLDIGSIENFQEFPEFLESNGKPSPTAKADDKLPLTFSVVKSIIMQLFSALHCLRNYDFSHGSPSNDSLKFNKEVVSYVYEGIHISGPITLKFLDFSTSGCTVVRDNGKNFLRLYSKSVVADEELKKRVYQPIIETVSLNKGKDVFGEKEEKDVFGMSRQNETFQKEEKDVFGMARQNETFQKEENENRVTVYKLKNPCKCLKASILFMYKKHLGLPVFTASFDAYAFMTVLMTERSFYSTVMSNPLLQKFWRSMWLNEDEFQVINDRVKEFHEKPEKIDISKILKILSDLSLRCDMIDFGWNMIKKF
jgi:hypothetical protein